MELQTAGRPVLSIHDFNDPPLMLAGDGRIFTWQKAATESRTKQKHTLDRGFRRAIMFGICSHVDLPTPLPLRDLFDAAVRHRTVRLTCRRCGHEASFPSPALWWLFERKGWRDRFREVERRFHCRRCRARKGETIRPALDLIDDPPSETGLAMPSETDWKRELRRRR